MKNRIIKWQELSQRQRMSPFPNYMSMECITKEMKKVVGVAYEHILLIFEENTVYIFVDIDDHKKVGQIVFKKIKNEPEIFVRLLKKQKQFEKNFLKFLNKNNDPKKLIKISNKKLASFHKEYEKKYKQVYSHYFPVLSAEIYFFNYLRDYIYKKEKIHKTATHYIDRLITERKAMVNWQEKRAALELCLFIQKNIKWKKYFKLNDPVKLIEKDKLLKRLIGNHEKKFFWITRDYEDPSLSFKDFVFRFKKLMKTNPKTELQKMLAEEEKLTEDIKKIVKKLNIDKVHQRLFQTMREGIYYKEYRKTIVSKSLYYYDPILKEIARRGNISLKQARHLLTAEVEPMLIKGIEMNNRLNERMKLSVFYAKRGVSQVYTGQTAKKYYNQLIKVNKNSKKLFGTPVSPGKAKGPVKIVINPDSFRKVKKGDIIATIQATPVFSHILSIAAGLICDGGPGITSHPATLAREAGIPGIIQLRVGTKVLKDGQKVEIDGDKGTVKIIKLY